MTCNGSTWRRFTLSGDLVTQRNVSNLMLIGAYRTNEVGPFHPPMSQMAAVRTARAPIEAIALEPLNVIRHCAVDHRDARMRAYPGSAFGEPDSYRVTGWGIRFFRQRIHQRAETNEGRLSMFHAAAWHWDMVRVRTKGLTDSA